MLGQFAITTSCLFFVVIFTAIDAILFGLGSIDRTWMPKADFNHLSWGYWMHVIGGFFAFISFVGLLSKYINDRDEDQYEKDEKY